jgi:signal peptidase I
MILSASDKKAGRLAILAGTLGLCFLLSGCETAYRTYRIIGNSMSPLLRSGDRIFVDESDGGRTDLHDGDVIVLRRKDAVVLKRIIAMPGETISGADRKIFRDGKQLEEPYLAPPSADDIQALNTFTPRTVKPGELFVMGDNRGHSFDSRAEEYAPVLFADVVGKYRWSYWRASSAAKQD